MISSVMDNERDHTIGLISRYWAFSTGNPDILHNTMTLSTMVDGDTGPQQPHVASRPPTLFRIIQGAGSVRIFIAAIAYHLNDYLGTDGFVEVSLLRNTWQIAVQGSHPIYSELLRAHRDSVSLWTSIFSLLRRVVTNADERPREDFTPDFIGIVLPLTHHTANTIHHAHSMGSLKDCTDLIERWVAADLFGTLDVVIPFCASVPLNCLSTRLPFFISKLLTLWRC